jgi:hypothetical protein
MSNDEVSLAGITPHSVGDLAYPLPKAHVTVVQTEWDDEWFILREWLVKYVAEDLPQLKMIGSCIGLLSIGSFKERL